MGIGLVSGFVQRHALEKLHVAEEMLHGGAVHAKLKGVEWAEWFL